MEIKGTTHMINKTSAIIASTLAIMAGSVTPASANTFDDHNHLLDMVKAAGVEVKINPSSCDTMRAMGWFATYKNGYQELVICQENKVKGSSRQVRWTAEDLDTVRHEAHHLTQDCMDGRLDGSLGSVYKRPIELGYRVMGQRKTHWVAETYGDNGASAHIQVMEIEAFAVAQMNDPMDQANDIRRYCF